MEFIRTYRITYDTQEKINQIFEVEADFEQDAWEAFYQEVETEEVVVEKHIQEV